MGAVVRRAFRDDASRTESAVRAQLAAGRWQLVTPTVLARHNGELTASERRTAVVLTAGRGAALAGLTALELDGLTGWSRTEVSVLIPKGSRPPTFAGLAVVVHETRRPPTTVVRGGLPVCTVARAAVDAASWADGDRVACALLAAVVRQRLVRPSTLHAELRDATRVRRRRLLLGVVADIAGGAEALSELDLLAFCRRNGLPLPTGQVRRRDRAGRWRYLDAVFTTARGTTVRVEIDGSIHLVEATYWADMRRGNDLLLAREPVLRFPSWAIRTDDADALRQLRVALAG